MTSDTASRFPSMGLFSKWREFLKTSSLARSVVLLLTGALVLLLLVNVSTYVMINRTASYNAQVDQTWQSRRVARSIVLTVQGAETAQRGYLLTGQPGFLVTFEKNKAAIPGIFADFEKRAAGDEVSLASAEALTRITRDKFIEMSGTLDLARQGRIGQAVSRVRTGQGQALTEQLDAEMRRLDAHIGQTLDDRRSQVEQSGLYTVLINAIAGVLILILAGIILMLVRRYLAEINAAKAELDRVNAGLEETVKARTGALVRANEEVQRFAYIVSHDLRSPLVNVMGYTSELEQAGKTIERAIARAETEREVDPEVVAAVREDMPEAVGFIRASTEKMDRLINAILKLSREGRRTLTPEKLDMTAMAGRIADSIRHQTEEKGRRGRRRDPAGLRERPAVDRAGVRQSDRQRRQISGPGPARPYRRLGSGRPRRLGRIFRRRQRSRNRSARPRTGFRAVPPRRPSGYARGGAGARLRAQQRSPTGRGDHP
jgi:CHASE3 domain sensor protein